MSDCLQRFAGHCRSDEARRLTRLSNFLGYWFRIVDGRPETSGPSDLAEYRIIAMTADILTAGSVELAGMRSHMEGTDAPIHWEKG